MFTLPIIFLLSFIGATTTADDNDCYELLLQRVAIRDPKSMQCARRGSDQRCAGFLHLYLNSEKELSNVTDFDAVMHDTTEYNCIGKDPKVYYECPHISPPMTTKEWADASNTMFFKFVRHVVPEQQHTGHHKLEEVFEIYLEDPLTVGDFEEGKYSGGYVRKQYTSWDNKGLVSVFWKKRDNKECKK